MSVLFRLFSAQTLNREATAILFCTALVQGVWEIKILVSGLSEKKVTQRLRIERFLEGFIVIISIINRIPDIVIDSISVAQITEIIPRASASATFITEQDPYNLFVAITKWSFMDCSMNFAPAKSFSLSELHFSISFADFFSNLVPAEHFSLPEFYFNILCTDLFSKFWWKCFWSSHTLICNTVSSSSHLCVLYCTVSIL